MRYAGRDMPVEEAAEVSEPRFQLPLEPGFVERVHLIPRRQLFKFPHQGLTARLFCIQSV